MTKIGNAAKDAVFSVNVVGRRAGEVSRSDRMIQPIAFSKGSSVSTRTGQVG